jgi:hypothetical protein
MATISTSGIAIGQIVRSEHVLRIINALNGVNPIDIIITGSLSTSGSLNVTGSTFLKGLPNTSRANVITYDPTTGQLSYLASASLGVTMSVSQPGGSDTQVQYNSGSVLAGNSAFKFLYNSSSLTLGTSTPTGLYSLTQGSNLTASGNFSYAQGSGNKATNTSAHAEGESTLASGLSSHAEGNSNTSSGDYSHAEGEATKAIGQGSHAEGTETQTIGVYSHAEGSFTQTIGEASHAEGFNTLAFGNYSHAEGRYTTSSADYSHAEGDFTQALGECSHAEGRETQTIGEYSHAEGYSTIASGSYQHVQGQFNISSLAQSAFIIGNGTSNSNRSNLVFASGSQFQVTGSLNVSGSGNFTNGLTVTGSINTPPNSILNINGINVGSGDNTTGIINVWGGNALNLQRVQCSLKFNLGNDDSGDPTQIISDNTVGLQISSSGYLHLSASVVGINDILRLTPRSTTPGSPTNGMIIISGSGVDQHIYCYLNSTWKQLD